MAGGGAAGSFVNGGTGGDTMAGNGGMGGTTAGAGGTVAGMAGMGGTVVVEPIVKTVWYIDNLRLQKKSATIGDGGAGGAGGAPSDAGAPAVVAAAGAPDAGGAGGAPAATYDPAFHLKFDTDLDGLAINMYGFSPNVGGTAGPAIIQDTTFLWDATVGKMGGGAKMSVPLSEPFQQADIARPFPMAVDLSGYELLADVQLKETGKIGDCVAAWVYAWSQAPAGYANGQEGEPSMGVTQKLTKGEWTTIRLDFDGPYGYHSTANFPSYQPTAVTQVGMQFVTFGCK